MKFKLFTYAVPPPEEPEELNRFLSSHRILSVQSNLVTKDRSPYIVFIVEYMGQEKPARTGQPKIDYKGVLSESDFAVYAKLRDLRKAISEKEGVPMYAVFTNAQPAEMVTSRVTTLAAMQQINGIGQSKTGKYGPRSRFVELC